MIGSLLPAFARSGEIKIGLDRARADGARRRFFRIAQQSGILEQDDFHVFAFGNRGQLQGGLQSFKTCFVRIEILRTCTSVRCEPVGCRERCKCRLTGLAIAAQHLTRCFLKGAAVQGCIEGESLAGGGGRRTGAMHRAACRGGKETGLLLIPAPIPGPVVRRVHY